MKKRIDLFLPDDLYERIKIISIKYNLSMVKTTIKLIEYGYLEFYKQSFRKEEL